MSWESFCWSPERLLKNSEVLDGLLARHADAVVTDRERALVAIGVDPDREVALGAHEARLGDRGEAQTVVGVRCVRNQLPEKDLPVAVQGMDHQLQQLTDFGLETAGFFLWRAHERAILGVGEKISSTRGTTGAGAERIGRFREALRPPAIVAAGGSRNLRHRVRRRLDVTESRITWTVRTISSGASDPAACPTKQQCR